MPKELFESVGMIRENKVAEIHGYETIRDRIANLAQSGDEELSIRHSLAKIQEKLDSIGSDRAPTKPYKQAQDLVQTLQAERKALDERRSQFQGWIEDRNRIAGEIAKLEQELAKNQAALLSARRQRSGIQSSIARGDRQRSRAISEPRSNLWAPARIFRANRLEELNQLVGARDSIAKHLSEVQGGKRSRAGAACPAESERQELAAYAAFAASAEAEKITEWFVSYLSLSLQKDGLQKTISRLQDEAGVLEKRLSELSPALMDPENDWQRMAREAAEEEQDCLAELRDPGGKNCAVRNQSDLRSANRTESENSGRRAADSCAASISARLIPGLGFNLSSNWESGLESACVVAAGILLIAGHKSAQSGTQCEANAAQSRGRTEQHPEGGREKAKAIQ